MKSKNVALLMTTVLMNMNFLTELKLYICNKYNFGFMLPPSDMKKTTKQRQMQFINTFLQKIGNFLSFRYFFT